MSIRVPANSARHVAIAIAASVVCSSFADRAAAAVDFAKEYPADSARAVRGMSWARATDERAAPRPAKGRVAEPRWREWSASGPGE